MVNRRPPPVREAAVNLNERRHLNGLDASGHRLHTFAQRVTQIIGIRVGWDRLIAIFRVVDVHGIFDRHKRGVLACDNAAVMGGVADQGQTAVGQDGAGNLAALIEQKDVLIAVRLVDHLQSPPLKTPRRGQLLFPLHVKSRMAMFHLTYPSGGPRRIGTIFEDSHLPLRLWLQAIHLLCASKKGISTRQIQRTLGCGMKTAWHLGHRIRLAMAPSNPAPLGGLGKVVEADETELARSRKTKRPANFRRKTHNPVVVSLVERGGNIRSATLDHSGVIGHVRRGVHPDSTLSTDQAQHYKHPPVANHQAVDHSKFEWVRGIAHTNTLEGFFSVLKRGLVGIYQHVDKKHLDRYLAEFDFRQNTRAKLGVDDEARAMIAIRGMMGKRLMYKDSFAAAI